MVFAVLLQLSIGLERKSVARTELPSCYWCPETCKTRRHLRQSCVKPVSPAEFVNLSFSCAKTSLSLSTQTVKWPRKQVFTSLGKTILPFLKRLQCPCFGGYSTIALLLLRHMTINLLFSQADKCFLSITVNYVCQLLISSQ